MDKPSLLISKEEIDNFTISLIKDYSGCEESISFLKEKYKDEVDNLRTRKKDFINLIDVYKKPLWVMSFFFNILDRKETVRFVVNSIFDNKFLINQDFAIKISEAVSILDYLIDENNKIIFFAFEHTLKTRIDFLRKRRLITDFATNPTSFSDLMAESKFLKGIITFVLKQDTKSFINFFLCLSEAFQWKYGGNSFKSSFDTFAKNLIDYSGVFYENLE